jgi:methyl acetate hydrolase
MATCDVALGPGWKWGLGLLLNTQALPGMRAAGSGGWVGICNTYFWVDPTARVTAAFYTQTLPLADPRVFQASLAFEMALYASL